MLHNTWKNQFNISVHRVFTLCTFLFSFITYSQSYPGIFQTIDKIIEIDEKRYQNLQSQISKNPLILTQIEKLKNVKLDPSFYQSIILNSPTKYLDFVTKNKCSFYLFLENELLSRPNFNHQSLPIQYINSQNNKVSGVVPAQNYFEYVYKTKCASNKDINKIFGSNNLANTLNSLSFEVPINRPDCNRIFNQWRENDYIAPLCKISEDINLGKKRKRQKPSINQGSNLSLRRVNQEIKRSDSLQSTLGEFRTDYLNHLCTQLDSEKKFCEKFLTKSYWRKMTNNNLSSSELEYKCKALTKKEELSKEDLKYCSQKMTLEPETCHSLGQAQFPSMFPRPNCNEQSFALNLAKLETNYHDCPAKIGNEGVVNLTRLIYHVNDQVMKSNPQNCDSYSSKTFLNFNLKNNNQDIWNLKICYKDPFNELKEKCLPVLLANDELGNYTETKVIAKILTKTKAAPRKTQCQKATRKEYKPDRLKWKYGCFIISESDNCTMNNCPKTIYYKNKKVEGIVYKGPNKFDYFPNTVQDDQKSMVYVFENARKFRRKVIRSITELKFYLNSSPKAVAHGVGCIEDIYPRNFKKNTFNQCNSIPFIIDAVYEENYRYYVSLRTGIDDLHSPRIISWYNIFNSLSNYQLHQPIKHWTLYGVR